MSPWWWPCRAGANPTSAGHAAALGAVNAGKSGSSRRFGAVTLTRIHQHAPLAMDANGETVQVWSLAHKPCTGEVVDGAVAGFPEHTRRSLRLGTHLAA